MRGRVQSVRLTLMLPQVKLVLHYVKLCCAATSYVAAWRPGRQRCVLGDKRVAAISLKRHMCKSFKATLTENPSLYYVFF